MIEYEITVKVAIDSVYSDSINAVLESAKRKLMDNSQYNCLMFQTVKVVAIRELEEKPK